MSETSPNRLSFNEAVAYVEQTGKAAFAALQAKFPGVLGGRQAVIRRADLGDKGVYYRAQVPFGSQGEAADFCASLKSAGGQCVIQRN